MEGDRVRVTGVPVDCPASLIGRSGVVVQTFSSNITGELRRSVHVRISDRVYVLDEHYVRVLPPNPWRRILGWLSRSTP